ncbi:MAG: hypothetical protein K2W95_34945 [Candidatus Obscuribacterales bacterium]|nr:hypothetical protein [Candidatus Obscuribacterales bacterium]
MGLERNALTGWIIAAAALLLLNLCFTLNDFPWQIDCDCAMYLRCGQLLLEGKLPYVDFVDINPPLIMYLNLLPASLAKLTSLPLLVAFKCFFWCVTVLAWLTATTILSTNKNHSDGRFFGPFILSAALFDLMCGLWEQFGQRDQLFAVWLFPFFLVRWLHSSGLKVASPPSILTGFSMGIAVCLRPQNLPVLVLLELFWLWRAKRLTAIFNKANIVCGGTMVLYAALLFLMPERAKERFFHELLPMVAGGYDLAYSHDFSAAFFVPFLTGCLPLLVLGAIIAIRHRSSLTVPLLIWTVAGYLTYVIQRKFWYNHCLSMLAGSCAIGLVQLRAVMPLWLAKFGKASFFRRPGFENTVSVLLCLSLLLPSIFIRKVYVDTYTGEDRKLIAKETNPTDSVMLLSCDLADAQPTLLLSNRQDACRYFFLFPLPMLIELVKRAKTEEESAKYLAAQQRFVEELKDDVLKNKPKLILIAEPAETPQYSPMKYLKAQGFMETALADYDQIGTCKGRVATLVAWKRRQ